MYILFFLNYQARKLILSIYWNVIKPSASREWVLLIVSVIIFFSVQVLWRVERQEQSFSHWEEIFSLVCEKPLCFKYLMSHNCPPKFWKCICPTYRAKLKLKVLRQSPQSFEGFQKQIIFYLHFYSSHNA